MGGTGSGNYFFWGAKSTTESQHQIDIRWMKKQRYLYPGTTGTLSWSCRGEESGSIGYRVETNRLVLNYRNRPNGGEWEDIEQLIYFDWTPCNYGGRRQWFRCPRCGRRIAVLYGGKYFFCRDCHDLSYSSQQESRPWRLMRKSRKIREQLGGSADLSGPFPEKPKNMHWKTYYKLRDEAERADRLFSRIIKQNYGMELF